MPNPNLYLYANYNWNFWRHVFRFSQVYRPEQAFILGNSRPANSHSFTMSIMISVQVSQSHGHTS